MSAPVTNIAAYHFAPLPEDREPLRQQLRQRTKELQLKGSILLATEGINLFLAGSADAIETILQEIRALDGFAKLEAKYSYSQEQPFRRMLVKLKQEIVTFRQDGINPQQHQAQKITPKQLKEWLDSGKKLHLLDTRNDYELRVGTFKNAIDPQLKDFRHFPEAVEKLPEQLKQEPVVMFCTGGIRCEKAGPYMANQGFQNIYQLEGGILKYFEEIGGDHWDGECFVFDQRVALNPQLQETETVQCFACQEPLNAQQQQDPRYQIGETCPYCFEKNKDKPTPTSEKGWKQKNQ